MRTVALTAVSASVSPTTSSASTSPKRPRTFDTPRWPMLKATLKWATSSAQRPDLSGRVPVVGEMVSVMAFTMQGFAGSREAE
jgi:hypothetical protein